MNLNAGYAGMGGASGGIVGALSTEVEVISRLRTKLLAFAAEYVKQPPNQKRLVKLSDELEGAIQSLHLISAISEKLSVRLISELGDLMKTTTEQSTVN